MTRDVGGGSGVTGSPSSRAGGRVFSLAGSGVGSECGGSRNTHRYLAARPGAPRFDGFARAVVPGMFLLEAGKHLLGTGGGPEGQRPAVTIGELLSVFDRQVLLRLHRYLA
jgi:hypothetical protein